MPLIESLLRIPEAAKLTGVSPRKFWQLISCGNAPPVVRIGRAVRVRASDLDLWITLGCPSLDQLEAERLRRGGVPR